MIRIQIVMIVGGGVLAFFGFQEFRVSSGTTRDAESVELAQLEKGKTPDNTHLKVETHFALYGGAVYEYEQSKYDSSAPGPSTKVNHCYYPIYSVEHPLIAAIAIANEDEEVPLEHFAVMVKTDRFNSIGAIPDGLEEERSVTGLVINRIDSLDSEEEDLVRSSFPNTDLEKILILEEGRKPSSMFASGGMILGGLALIVVGIGLFFLRSAHA